MIKKITSLLNPKHLNQPYIHRYLISNQKSIDQQDKLSLQQQLQTKPQTQQQITDLQQQNVVTQTRSGYQRRQRSFQQMEQDDWQNTNLIDSNWKQMAGLIHTKYYQNMKNPYLRKQIKQKLQKIQKLYGFDLNNLDRIKITQNSQFQTKRYAITAQSQSHRYFENNILENTKVNHIMSLRKFNELIRSNDLRAIKHCYKNFQFNGFNMTSQTAVKVLQTVVQSDFQLHFLLNLLSCAHNPKYPKKNVVIPNKNFQKVLLNINNLQQLNKLQFFWTVYNVFQKGENYLNCNVINHQLTKIKFEGFDFIQSQKSIRYIYSSILGRDPLQKVIQYSLNKFAKTFEEFVSFWAVFNLLMIRLFNMVQNTASNQQESLNFMFELVELNLTDSKQIISKLLPQILHDSKNKNMFEIYKNHAKQWLGTRTEINNVNISKYSTFDQYIFQKITAQQPLKVTYQPFNTQTLSFKQFQPITFYIKTSPNSKKNIPKPYDLLSQSKMIQQLTKGNYNFALNYFLLIYHRTLDKSRYNQIRQIIHEANENYEFDNENSKALYILKQINEKIVQINEPIAFRNQFLGSFKVIKGLESNLEKKKVFRNQNQNQYQNRSDKKFDFFEESHKFSRKKAQNRNSEEYDGQNSQRIRNKPKKYPEGGALFRKNKSAFSTTQQVASSNSQKDSYEEYRQVVRNLTEEETQQFKFLLDQKMNEKQLTMELEKKSKEINQKNHVSLFNQKRIPVLGSGVNLIKYLFLQKPFDAPARLDQKLRNRLKTSFISQIGALQKDFSPYLQNCRFTFALAPQVYISLLQEQKVNYVRKSYKTIVSHIIAYRNQITPKQIQLICQIAQKNKIGITLLQIYNLLIDNKIAVNKQSIYMFCQVLQKFKKINNDIFMMTKKYCENLGMEFEMKMLSSYVKSLLQQQQQQKIAQLCQILKSELKPKPYKLKQNLSAQQNIKLQKQHRQLIKRQYNRILFQIVDLIVTNVANKLPKVVSSLFDQYQKTKLKLNPKQIAISLIVYCNNLQKFLSIIKSLKQNPKDIILQTFQCAIKALRLNTRQLESYCEQTFNVTLFKHNFILDQKLINLSLQLFKTLHTPTVFIKFLQYVLRYNIPVNYEMKNAMYFVMNNTNDDFSKNTISGLLDFIFNVNRQKQREEFRKTQIQEEQKAVLLSNLDKVQNVQQSDVEAEIPDPKAVGDANKKIQKNKIVKQNIQKDLSKDVLIDQKTASSASKVATQQLKKQKVQKPSAVKTQKRNIKLLIEQDSLTLQNTDGRNLKKSNLKKKLRNKSFNDFEEMFTQKQQISEQLDAKAAAAKAKGGKQPIKGKGGDVKKKNK